MTAESGTDSMDESVESSTSKPVLFSVNVDRQLLNPIIISLSVCAIIFAVVVLLVLIVICVRQRHRRGE